MYIQYIRVLRYLNSRVRHFAALGIQQIVAPKIAEEKKLLQFTIRFFMLKQKDI